MALTHPANLVFQVSDAPTPIYKGIQLAIYIIKSNHLPSHIKRISVPIHYAHEQYPILAIDPVKLKTTIHSADIVTKISTRPLLERH